MVNGWEALTCAAPGHEARSWSNTPSRVVHWEWEVLIHGDRLHSESNGGVGSRGWGSAEWGKREWHVGEESAGPRGEIRWAH